MADALLQTLTIKLNAEVGNTKRKLNDVATSVERLEKVGKDADWSVFEQLRTNLEGIAQIDFSNVADSLKNVVDALKALGIAPNKVKDALKMQTPKMGATDATKGGEEPGFSVADTKAQSFAETMGDVAKTTEEAGKEIKKIGKNLKTTGKEAEKSAKGFKKLLSSIKRITFYRMVRRVIQLIGQVLTEGIQKMAMFDSNFNASMSELKTSLEFFKNSLATIIAPIIEMVTPVLTALLDGLAEINNMLGELFSAIAGKDYFQKATKGAEDYAESLKKVKSQALGIDELNVLNQDSTDNPFEEVAVGIENSGGIGGFLGDVGQAIKELFGDLKESILPIINALSDLFDAVSPVLEIILDIVKKIVSNTVDGVNESIGKFIEMIAKLFNVIEELLIAMQPLIDLVIDIVVEIINTVNSTLGNIFDVIGGIFDAIIPVIHELGTILKPFFEIIANIVRGVFGIASGDGELNDGSDGLSAMVSAFVEGFKEMFKLLFSAEFWQGMWNAIKELVKGFFNAEDGVFFSILDAVGTLGGLLSPDSPFASLLNPLNLIFGGAVPVKPETTGGTQESGSGEKDKSWKWYDIVATVLTGGIYGIVKAISDATGSKPKVMASGGFIEDGFFYANHNELVGQFSTGRTAVANNEMITEGIYRAVKEAMQDSNSNGEGREIVVAIDGQEVGRAVDRYNGRQGMKMYSGGKYYGY